MNKLNHIGRHRWTLSHVLSTRINQVQKCDHVLPTVSKTCMNISQKWIHVTTNCCEKRNFNNNNNNRREWRPPQLDNDFVPPKESKRIDKNLLIGLANNHTHRNPRARTFDFIETWMDDKTKTYEPGKTVINWEEEIVKAKETNNMINEKSFGVILLTECTRREELHLSNPKECSKQHILEIAQDFMKWNRKPTLLILAAFMQLCSYNANKVNEKSLLNMYSSISTKVQGVWSSDLATKVIAGLLKTSKWKDSIQIKDECYKHEINYLTCTQDIAIKAFEEKEFDLGFSLLSEHTVTQDTHYRRSSLEPFIAFLRHCPPTEESIKKILDFLDLYEIYPSRELVSAISRFFEKKLNYKVRITRIHGQSGMCENCREPLDKNDLSTEEFEKLQNHFLKNIVLAEDVFINTTPDEIEEYQAFLTRYGPFDVVLDALNIAFSLKMRTVDPTLVESAAYKFNTQGKRTLVVGRKHMNRWPRSVLRNISETSYLFLIDDSSEDDPFIIYGALKSGPSSIIVSKDFMRQHISGLRDPEIARLFKRWRWTHQMDFYWNKYEIVLRPFAQLLPVPQKNNTTGTYHIPYSIERVNSPFDIPDKWMCITPKMKS